MSHSPWVKLVNDERILSLESYPCLPKKSKVSTKLFEDVSSPVRNVRELVVQTKQQVKTEPLSFLSSINPVPKL